ncbi:MAG: class I SAM-dependent methyltransferase [Thermoplasmata archaeon]
MHASVMEFLRSEIRREDIEDRDVLEIGSQDVNGSPRTVVEPFRPARYIGVDFVPGKSVDLVLDVKDLLHHFGTEKFDVVISTEMLEHAHDWKTAVRIMKRVLRPFGLLLITTRGPGFPYHGYPHDYWRFTVDDFRGIFSDMETVVLKPDVPGFPGVLFKARKREREPVIHETDLSRTEVARVLGAH